jgi:hypothetical protein
MTAEKSIAPKQACDWGSRDMLRQLFSFLKDTGNII